jgi:hypothetical protein
MPPTITPRGGMSSLEPYDVDDPVGSRQSAGDLRLANEVGSGRQGHGRLAARAVGRLERSGTGELHARKVGDGEPHPSVQRGGTAVVAHTCVDPFVLATDRISPDPHPKTNSQLLIWLSLGQLL